MEEKKKLGIYIHIPFCVKKCLYCDFLSDSADKSVIDRYIEALINEIGYTALDSIDFKGQFAVDTIFFGGGTPSLMDGEVITHIINAIRDRFDVSDKAEITIECNPGTVTKQKLDLYKKAGINRLSIGLQSANDEELKLLGRIHDYRQFLDTYSQAREAGFDNINVDLMSAIPGQTVESYIETLEKIISLSPEHISAYSLIIEPDTPFYEIYSDDRGDDLALEYSKWPSLPDEDSEREMYHMTKSILEKVGYYRYEISNYSLKGYECRHNISYWNGTDYLGLGVGAASYMNGIRYSNTSDIYTYMKACEKLDKIPSAEYLIDDEEISDEKVYLNKEGYHEAIQSLSNNERMEEYMFLGLRMMCGISKKGFKERFDIPIDDVYGAVIKKLTDQKLLKEDGDILKLTDRGIDVSNVVLANFLL